MPRTPRLVAAAATSSLLLLALTACFPFGAQRDETSSSESSSSSPEEETESTENSESAAAMETYVQAERDNIPQVLEQSQGAYSDLQIDGTVGEVSTITFAYTYADPTDWDVAGAHLEGQRDALEGFCDDRLFPTMERAGISGPLEAVYAYGDVETGGEPQWSHTCTQE
ncbi:MAG: hypothetical protein ABW040_10550 [Microbacteriaceae bacterium]